MTMKTNTIHGLSTILYQNIKVLNIVSVDADAVFAEKSVLYVLALGVEEVEELVGVHLFGGRE